MHPSQGKLNSENSTCPLLRSDKPWLQCCCGVPSFFCSRPLQLFPYERQSTVIWSCYCSWQLVEIAQGEGQVLDPLFLPHLPLLHWFLNFPYNKDSPQWLLQQQLQRPVTFAKKLLQPYQNMWGKNGSLGLNQFSLFIMMTIEPSFLGRASNLFFFFFPQNHWGTRRLPTKNWDSQRDYEREGMALILLCPEDDLSSASCVMDIRAHLKKNNVFIPP